jgi:hypothetical protein
LDGLVACSIQVYVAHPTKVLPSHTNPAVPKCHSGLTLTLFGGIIEAFIGSTEDAGRAARRGKLCDFATILKTGVSVDANVVL